MKFFPSCLSWRSLSLTRKFMSNKFWLEIKIFEIFQCSRDHFWTVPCAIGKKNWKMTFFIFIGSLCFHFSPTCPKAKFRKIFYLSNKFFHNFHLSESSFTCPLLRASRLARRMHRGQIVIIDFVWIWKVLSPLKSSCFQTFKWLHIGTRKLSHIIIWYFPVERQRF